MDFKAASVVFGFWSCHVRGIISIYRMLYALCVYIDVDVYVSLGRCMYAYFYICDVDLCICIYKCICI